MIIPIFIVSGILITKSKKVRNKKRGVLLTVISCVVIMTVLMCTPIENLFFTFKTPEDAFNYSHNGSIVDVIDGKESCIVLYKENDESNNKAVFIKSHNGYKLCTSFLQMNIILDNKYLDENNYLVTSIYMYKIKNTSDYYLFCDDYSPVTYMSIKDNKGSDFTVRAKAGLGNKAYAYINEYDSEYMIYLNGREIKL